MKVFKNKDFMILWLGQNISKLGTTLYDIALMWYMYKKTGSSIALGLSVLCFTVPSVLIAPLAGVFADRLDKKKIIINTDILSGIIMLVFSYFIFVYRYPVYILYIFMILSSMVTAVFNPSISSSIPVIVKEEDLKDANTLNQMSSQITNILGPVLAGILISFMNIGLLFFINGLSFLICAIIESFIVIPKVIIKTCTNGIASQFKEGLKYIASDKPLLYLVMAGGVIINFFLAPLSIYETILSTKILNVGSTGYGMMNSAISAGALLGALLIMANVFNDKYKMTVIGLCIEGIAVAFLGLVPNYYVALLSEAILGLGVAMASVGISTLYQTLIPKDKMGRVMALVSTLCSISVPLGTLLGSIIIAYLPLNIILIISGVFIIVTGFLLIPLLRIKTNNISLDSALK
ncbi:MFS transporter [Clostridium akagii]|uniref:MFS transporter n=1 Tax=Clostridium akagii TaxID=91623 RepID=UPI00047CD4A2|nr:MFS transporter [Clostridium akagii]